MHLLVATYLVTHVAATATRGWIPKFENLVSFGDR